MHRVIGLAADEINAAGYGELAGAMQNADVGEMTLSIAKLFERPSRSYSVRSIPTAIRLLQECASELPLIEPISALTDFARCGIDGSSTEVVD